VKHYDRAYFDRWYRDPRRRPAAPAELDRKVHLAVAAAEWLLDRRVRSVLDVGCGEAPWRAPLMRLRPRVRYVGVDPSEYAVARYGRTRGIRRGHAHALDALDLGPSASFDLIICADVLHYLSVSELRDALRAIHARLAGVAWLELFTSADDIVGDMREFKRRPPSRYRELITKSGLMKVGPCCYARAEIASGWGAMERGWA
jgi:SAM-dependent methyltransferase